MNFQNSGISSIILCCYKLGLKLHYLKDKPFLKILFFESKLKEENCSGF